MEAGLLSASSEDTVTSGGGFRDSLADMSEELCPSSAATPVPLPFFVRTANQVSSQEFLLLCVCKPPGTRQR